MRMNISDIGILIVLVYFVLAGIIAGLFSEVAREKGYSSSEYFWACFLLGLAGWLLVIALPDRGCKRNASTFGMGENRTKEKASTLEINDKIELDYCTMTLDDVGIDKEIRTGSSQYGAFFYQESENGDPFYYIHGTFKNTGNKPVDIQHIAVQFCFDGEHKYCGEVDGVSSGCTDFITDVAPLSTVEYYIYTAVPQELLDKFTICQIQMGFTKNFDSLVLDGDNLPIFKYCDDIVTVKTGK